MRNIIEFNKFRTFKKLNEEAPTAPAKDVGGYGSGGDAYLANVKGTFAGAENTLIGSNFIVFINWIKRKNHERIFRKLSNVLYSEYMKGLLRYILRVGKNLPNPKSIYTIKLVMDLSMTKVSQKTYVVKINPVKTSDNMYLPFDINSKIVTEDDKELETDGIYLIDGIYVKVEKSIITEKNILIKDEPSEDEEPTDEPSEDEPSEDESSEIEIDEHIKEYIQNIRKMYDNLQKEEKNSFLFSNEKQSEIKEMSKMFSDSIEEMNEILKREIDDDIRKRISVDLPIYKKTVIELENLYNHIQKDAIEYEKSKSQDSQDLQQPVELKDKKVGIGESLYFINEEVGTHQARNIREKTKKSSPNLKINPDYKDADVTATKIGDELNMLSTLNIDLDDQEFLKQFNDEEIRKEVTKVVLESKPEIVNLQLSAERFYIKPGGKDMKLENYWLKLVENQKSKYSRFMLTDLVDPGKLRKEIGTDGKVEVKQPNNTVIALKTADDLNKANKNSKLNAALKVGKFKDQQSASFGIFNLNGEYYIYNKNTMDVPYGTKSMYHTYKIIAKVKKEMFDEAEKNVDKDNFEDFIIRDYKNFMSILQPKKTSVQSKTGNVYHFLSTFIVSATPGTNLNTGVNNTGVFIIHVYGSSKNPNEKITENNVNKFQFYYVNNAGENIQLKHTPGSFDKDAKIMFSVTGPIMISPDSYDVFGLDTQDSFLNLSEVTKVSKDKGISMAEIIQRKK